MLLCVCGWFKQPVSIPEQFVIIVRLMSWQRCGRKRLWRNWRRCAVIYLVVPRRNTERFGISHLRTEISKRNLCSTKRGMLPCPLERDVCRLACESFDLLDVLVWLTKLSSPLYVVKGTEKKFLAVPISSILLILELSLVQIFCSRIAWCYRKNSLRGRLQLKCDGTRWRRGGSEGETGEWSG